MFTVIIMSSSQGTVFAFKPGVNSWSPFLGVKQNKNCVFLEYVYYHLLSCTAGHVATDSPGNIFPKTFSRDSKLWTFLKNQNSGKNIDKNV